MTPREPSIKLHPEHGLNPTLCQCFLCGEDTGEIALLGAAYKERAPMHMVTTVEPCKKCRETYLKKGTMIVEAGGSDGVPSGRVFVVTDEAFKKAFTIPIPARKIVFCEPDVFDKIFGGVKHG